MKKVLFLAYYFPPMGGGGVQRVAKFCRYLPFFDYCSVVVAARSEFYDHPDDGALNQEVKDIPRYNIVPPTMNSCLHRIAQSDLGRFFNLPQTQWIFGAQRAGEIAIQEEKPDLICASVSPFPMAQVAGFLSEKYHIPWVLDMRDPWALDPIQCYATKIHYEHDLRAMKRACRRAHAVIMNTPDSLDAVRNCFPYINPDKFSCITNGWDVEDFKSFTYPGVFRDTVNPLTIVHTGVFHTRSAYSQKFSANKSIKDNWTRLKNSVKYSVGDSNLLTRTPHYLFQALALLLKEKKISLSDVRLIFAGAFTPDDVALARTHGLDSIVDYRGYLDHAQSLQVLNQAHVLFLPLHEPEKMLPLIVPGKTYEYLAARRPILALVPPGDAQRFVEQARLGYVCEPTSVEQIASTLLTIFKKFRCPAGLNINPNLEFIARFERKILTQNLAALFDKILSQ
jgi:glycosyltransferase involved in cell wall biosynthesis